MEKTLNKEGVPGSIQAIETLGEYYDLNSHLHIIAIDGLFNNNKTFFYSFKLMCGPNF